MTLYQRLFDAVLTRMDAETAHHLAMRAMRAAAALPAVRGAAWRRMAPGDPGLAVEALGLRFPGPVGIAAGFDKNAVAIDALGALGFAFVEVGTVTARPQPGNSKPRLHRLVADRAVVNRMGFNNDGAATVAARLAKRRRRRRALPVVVGVNIGKSKAVPESEAIADYEASARLLAPYADYLVVNVSSPNTPGLRDLQAVDQLRPLLTAVRRQADEVTLGRAGSGGEPERSGRPPARRVPLLVKIAPDLSDDGVVAVADLAIELGLDGIIATNTTVSRDGLSSAPDDVERAGAGGLSGAPLAKRALQVLLLLQTRLDEKAPAGRVRPVLAAAGGIESAQDVRERLRAGATLVQAYTGFVYGGPLWPMRVQRELAALRRSSDEVAE